MKWFLLLLLFYQMGYAQQTITDYNTMEPIVTKDFEKFNQNEYSFLKEEQPEVYRGFDQEKNYIVIVKANAGISYIKNFNNSYFSVSKIFYSNGNIKRKGIAFNNSFCKATWYEFSEDGKLIKETNYDAPYKFTFEQVLQFCEKEKIPLTKGPITGGIHTEIARGMDNALKKNVWYVSWFKQSDLIETFVLDAETGKVIDKKYSEYINN
ncbi:hypothetical protein BWK63_13530 [Flavobacterium covae]|uniref:hypothetical protein n=1 Tax=Flavobacterium TaxID=237 RepID=UPI000B6567B3|nr:MULTISPECIES: hypothetical protein [Flavobacterium]OWP79965.1 hypothetical protein BWK63_13530 [Flavobacterium covae]POR17765.1 hypothetical protein BWK57_14050 [Flavobacterium columnare]